MPYIYKITNDINKKIYIGKTSEGIEQRFQRHYQDSKKSRNEKRPLYDAINKYGIEHFHIEELEQVKNDEEACERERFWIEKLRTYIGFKDCNGYNATLGGDGKRLYDYEQIANKYLEFKKVSETCKYFNCDRDTVRFACKEYNIEILQHHNEKRIKRTYPDGNIKIYNSMTDAAQDIEGKKVETARKNISRAINKSKTGIAYGSTWKIINDAE